MKKIFLILSMLLVMVCLFAISVSAASHSVTYCDRWGTEKAWETTDGNGQITLKDTPISTGDRKFFGWFTLDGRTFAPGETVTFEESVSLLEAYGFEGYNDDMKTQTNDQWDFIYIQLQEDLVLDKTLSLPWGGRLFIDLNGHNITSSAKTVLAQQRSSLVIVGKGKITHTGDGNFYNARIHGYGDGNACLYIGKYVEISTPGVLYNWESSLSSGHINGTVPFQVLGKITCKQLLNINGSLDESLGVYINPSELTITGDLLFKMNTYPADALISVQFAGGTFNFPEASNDIAFWNSGNSQSFEMGVFGGSYSNGKEIVKELITDEYALFDGTANEIQYSTVVSTKNCTHTFGQPTLIDANCVDIAKNTYKCTECQLEYFIGYGNVADHKWVLINTDPATATTFGTKYFECEGCKRSQSVKYSLDPSEIAVKVKVSDFYQGIIDLEVKASDVFEFSTSTNLGVSTYTLIGLKGFDSYIAMDILEIEIPFGIVVLDFAQDNTTLKTITIADNANIKIKSFAKATAVEIINIGSATVEFSKGCENEKIHTINSYKEGAEVFFPTQCFQGNTTIANLEMSSGSTYVFGSNCFKQVANLKKIVFPDYSNIVFSGEAPFYQCGVEYVYFGRGMTEIKNKPFDYCQKMQTIIMMEVQNFTTEYTFCVEDSGERPVEVYIHSESITIPNNTFYQCHGITIYTNAPITNAAAFNQCNAISKNGVDYPAYTIVYGIPHKYTPHTYEPTCIEDGVESYFVDCPCGEFELTTYSIFVECLTNSGSYDEYEMSEKWLPAKGHTPGEKIDIVYENGFYGFGLTTFICDACEEEYTEEEATSAPLFKFRGYSSPENGTLKITVGFAVNLDAIEAYEKATGKTIEYGAVGAIEEKLNGKAPFETGVSRNNVARVKVDRKYFAFDFVISGFKDEHRDLAVVMSAYVREVKGTEARVVYLQSTEVDKPIGVTINSLWS